MATVELIVDFFTKVALLLFILFESIALYTTPFSTHPYPYILVVISIGLTAITLFRLLKRNYQNSMDKGGGV